MLLLSTLLCLLLDATSTIMESRKVDIKLALLVGSLKCPLFQSQSQSNLISRVSSATELLPHTQSLHSKYSLYSVGGAMSPLPPIPSRPGSSRPQSRVDLVEVRPMSSRPMSGRPPSLTQLDQARPSTSRSPSRNTSRQQSAGPLQVHIYTHLAT